jgi:hypothetical protein
MEIGEFRDSLGSGNEDVKVCFQDNKRNVSTTRRRMLEVTDLNILSRV